MLQNGVETLMAAQLRGVWVAAVVLTTTAVAQLQTTALELDDRTIDCLWNVDNSTLLDTLPAAIERRFDRTSLLIIYEGQLGHYPDGKVLPFPGRSDAGSVGLAEMFRDEPFRPPLQSNASQYKTCTCRGCTVCGYACCLPRNASFVQWQRNYNAWMASHLAKLEADVRRGTAGASYHRAVPLNYTGTVVIDWSAR